MILKQPMNKKYIYKLLFKKGGMGCITSKLFRAQDRKTEYESVVSLCALFDDDNTQHDDTWFVSAWQFIHKLACDQDIASVGRSFNLMEFALAGTRGPLGHPDWFLAKATHSTVEIPPTNLYQWVGPGLYHTLTMYGHSDVVSLLQRLPEELAQGHWKKNNNLGFNLCNALFWPERDPSCLGLAIPHKQHVVVRPILAELLGKTGRWSDAMLEQLAEDFLLQRQVLHIKHDLSVWTTWVLHKIHFGLNLSMDECMEFVRFANQALIFIGIPPHVMKNVVVKKALSDIKLLKHKQKLLVQYQQALEAFIPSITTKSHQERVLITSVLLDSLLFAGGVSVPTILQYAIGIPYSKWGQTNIPDINLRETNLLGYVLEIVRFFNPVSSVSFTEHNFETFLNLAMAQRDTRVWGQDAHDTFRIRSLAEYHRLSVGWAEFAEASRLSDPKSRNCPAKHLSLSMCTAFLKAFRRIADSGWLASKAPDEITINSFGVSSFRLERPVVGVVQLATVFSGAETAIAHLTTTNLEGLRDSVAQHNKFTHTSLFTKVFIAVVHATMKGVQHRLGSEVNPNFPPIQTLKKDRIDIGGLWFPTDDEDKKRGPLNVLNQILSEQLLTRLPFKEDTIVYFDSLAEAYLSMEETFGRTLPPHFDVWEEFASDDANASICFSGVFQWYLRTVNHNVQHPVPPHATLEVDLSLLGHYETRPPWTRYGSIAYFDKLPNHVNRGVLLGIYSCVHARLIVPGDPLWVHTKMAFRSALLTMITFKEHLVELHWIISNGLVCAVRETLSPNHPLRRLLKPHHYLTVDINNSSRYVLLPVDQLAFRCFGFSETGHKNIIRDVLAQWRYVPFPTKMRQQLPDHVLRDLPLYTDGMLLWNCIQRYVQNYLEVLYSSPEACITDPETCQFWEYFETHFETPWCLPGLSFESLVEFITYLIWMVTGGHEVLGSILPYLTDPNGFGAKLQQSSTQIDVETFALGLIIIALTGDKRPLLINDWSHLFTGLCAEPRQQSAVIQVVQDFRKELIEISETIDRRNTERSSRGEQTFTHLNPAVLECSVSI